MEGSMSDSPQSSWPSQRDGRPRRRRRATMRQETDSDAHDVGVLRRSVAVAEAYRFSNRMQDTETWADVHGAPLQQDMALCVEKGTPVSLGDLVKYNPIDLFSRAWLLVPSELKRLTCPPFGQLPELPDVMNALHSNNDEVARFMRLTALEVAKRRTVPTPFYLRCLLVRAAVRLETGKTELLSFSTNTYSEESIQPQWEDESEVTEEVSSSDTVPTTDANHIDAFDWTMAVLSESLHPRVPHSVISMLHRVLNRCGIKSSSETLRSWGIGRLIQILLHQIKEETGLYERGECGTNWLTTAVDLLFKLVLASRNADALLAIFRWAYKNRMVADALPLKNVPTWITSIEANALPRMRLDFPTVSVKLNDIPLIHSLGLELSQAILGMGVVTENGDPYGVVFTKRGVYKFLLIPPYSLVGKNEEDPVTDCRGVFLEDGQLVVQSKFGCTASFYDVRTLRVSRVLENRGSEQCSEMYIYNGMERFVTPHFYHNKDAPLFAAFHPRSGLKGRTRAPTLFLPSGSDSASLQFLIFPTPTQQHTSMKLLYLSCLRKHWISVSVVVDGQNSLMSMVFEHGEGGVVVEVREPIHNDWALWGATLQWVNNVAMWNIFKNGVLIRSCAAGGASPSQSGTKVSISLFEGTFSGFISGLRIWHRSIALGDMLASANGRPCGVAQGCLLCCFKMNEGTGCCLRSAEGAVTWKGPISWAATPTMPFNYCVEESERIPYVPHDDYYVVTNTFETAILLIEGIDKNTVHSAPQFFSWNRASPQTLARLLSILEDLLPLVSIPNAEDDTLLLLTCVCGRLLTQQMSWIRRECPPNLVPVTVGMYERLNGCECQPGSFQREVQDVFTELHRVFLIRCASYDYQLQRITEVTKLADLKDLLTADYIPSFVAILLKREELKKPFMTFLNRLKEECVSESKSVLNGEVSAAFKPSSVMLSVLLSIFSQKINPQWHLVAVALVNSLCSNIMQLFDRIVVGVRSDMSLFATRLDLLKQTSLGVVVFPIVHFLSDVDIDSSVAVEILTLLEKTQRLLLPYICASNSESTQHCIVETHGINIPASSSHTTILDLRHARSVEISHDCSTTDDIPEIRVTLVTNTLQRNVEVMQSQRAAFECGGIFEISVNNKQELTVTLDAQVEIRTDQTHWIHDICFAISYAILYSTHQLLLTGLLNPLVFTRESILRAGLTEKVLKEHRVYTKRNEIAFNKTDLTDLIQLSEGTGDVFNLWQSILSQRRVPHLEKVEHVLRVFCAAHVWHLHRPQQTTLKAQLEASLDFIRKKCILILEVMQQKGEDGMLERAKFLLYDVNPREKVEFCIAEQQQTEEPLVFRSGDYHQHLRHDWHSGMRGSTRTSCDGESRGLSLTCTLVQKMQQAVLHAELYRLQGDLVATHQFDTDMIWSILSLHLRRREQVYVQSLLEGKRKGFVGKHPPADPATYSTPITLDRPHIEPLLGCGFQHELELQKAFCTFFNTLVQQSDVNCPKPVDPRSSCSALTVIPICAMLCHPWDNMDASFMNHDSVFNFLEKCIRVSLDDASNHSSQKSDGHIPWYLPAQECGLFSVQNRCGIIPNTLHPVARNAVDIINGDTVGVHIEDIEVVCLAQNDWKLVKTDTRMNDIETQDDFASVATGCLLIDVPEVLYFEMTLEIVLSSEIVASIGVTESQRTLQKSEVSDNTITLCSDGFVRCGDTATRFVEEWSVGDVIGCGVIVPSRSVFFTRRGEFLGIARECPFTVAQPLVSAKANDGLVKLIVNFGGNVPFAFDITSLHSSCLSQLTSLAMISESAFLTSHYIVGLCFKNLLAHEQSLHPLTVDSTGTLLERASAFVCASALRCVARLKEICNDRHTDIAVKSVQYESTNILLARLFTTANTVIDCFRFNSVTPGTHLSIVRFCCLALTTTRERWIKVRAARCLGVLASVLRHDYLTATITKLEKCGVKLEVVVDSLVELARVSTTRCSAQSAFVAQWANGKARVAGSGAFYGKTPLPKKGKHIVGFRIRRHKLMARARGAPLGGDYYIGLVSGHSHTVDIKSLIEREDVYTLHNGNYYTQVNHPLATHLRHHHENHRRAYGNDQIVWLELNAGTGEIIFYRDDMEPTGTVFSGIKKVDNLYPFVFLFNEDAVCDLIRAPTQLEEYTDDFVVGFRRSVAVHALQQLHLVPPFDSKISRWIRSHLKRSRKDIGNCLVALALLGGEKSHLFCHHETHGAVVVHSVSHSTSKAIVHLDADSEMHLLATDVTSLKPSFVLPPVFSAAETEGQKCGKWLVDELRSVLREIFTIVPLLNDEEEQRRRIESLFSDTVVEIANTAFVSLHMQQQDTTKRQATKDHLRGTSKGAVMYIGVSSETDLPPEPQAVARSKDVWALCTHDSAATNSINCSVEPGMIFGAVEACFDSGDVVCVMVDRSEGTAAFSRCRAGKWVNFGVLFESIPPNKLLRPIVVTVPDSVVVFSFLDCHTFPSRNAFPPSSVGTCTHSTPPISCTSCDRNLIQEWYEGEGGVCLCHECFNMWHYPKTMFYLSRPEDPIPDYLLSQCSPKALVVGELVNFTENAVLTWSTDKSVNVEVEKSVCMAVEDGAFAVLDLLSPNVSPRIDVLLSHVAGIKGFAFSGLHNFNLLWQAKNTQKRNVDIEENTLLVSSTVISQGLKVVLELTFSNSAGGDISNTRRVFVGVAGAVVDCRKASSADFERYLANGNICGTWCDLYFAASASRTLFLLIDTRKASVMMSFSLLGLHTRPAVVSCSSVAEEDTGLRIAIFSRSPYRVTSTSGWVSTDEGVLRFSSSYVAVGLVSEEAIGPRLDVMNSKKLLFDTVAHTSAQCNNLWQIAPLVHEEGSGILFSIGDILTVETENGLLTVYRNGLLIATHPMSEEMISKPQKFMIYLSTRGMMATVVPPIYGKLHVGKVVQTFGADVGAVECLCPCVGKQRYIVRRRDVHHCAISASVLQPAVGSKVSFKVGSLFNPKRGSVISVDENTLTVCEDGDDKHLPITVKRSNAFLLDNEGADKVEQTPYPLLALPDSATVRVFEVGSTKYKQQCSTSYNGIMFDVRAHSAAILTGLTVMTCSQGRHRVEVFFKRGSHESHEKEAMSWTKLFSNYVDMHTGTQFSVKFRGVLVEANSTFALYINATHNCGVGYYTVQEGCSGGLSSVVDSDGALTVFMGRVSESSTPFCRVVHQTHGFCGSIVYVQSKGSQTDALWEMGTAPYNSDWWHHGRCATMPGLLSKPSSTLVSPTLEFTLEVHDQAMVLQRLLIPIYIDSKTCQSRGPANLHVSLFYAAFQCDVVDPDEADHNWVWVCHKTVAMGDNMHQFCLDDLCIELSRGTYIFTAVCEKSMGLGSGKMWERLPCFVRPSLGRNWSVRNKCCAVHGFAGYLYAVSSRNATSYGAKTTLSTGGGLFQDSVSSSNGILFDICSKRDILLEELFCVAQATAENVQVAVFWREGSLIGAEQSPRMWKCLVTNELNLEKRKVFSPGRLNIHLSAGCVYALYVTTTSSCGVRFYNGADGIVGKVGHKFDEDANLTVFVGKRSDGLVPFSNVPADPRAFRGLITYRTLAQANSPMKNASTFPAIKGFVATRILAALIALSNNPATFTKLFVDSHLADLLVKLISSSASIVVNEDSVDHSPCDVIDEKLLSALCEGSITLLSSGNDVTRFSSLCKGDLAVVASSMGVLTRGTVVRLIDDPDAGRDVSVQNTTDNPGEVCAIPISNLLPIVECSYCYKPFAVKDTCTVAGQSHLPTFKVEEQLINILAKHLIQRHDKASSEGSALAASIVHRAKTPAVALSALMNPDKRARCYGTTIGSNTVEYIVPLYLLYSNKSGTYSDFVYVNVMSAFVALSFVPCVDGWQLNLLTDLPLRLIGHPGAKAFLVTLNATSDHKDEYELTLPPVQYCTGYGGPASQHLLTLVDSLLSYTLPLQDGCLHLRLSLYETALPPKTAKVSGFHAAQSWLWAGGYRVVELKPTISHEIDGVFSNATWPQDKPRFWQLTVTSSANVNVFFLEVVVFFPKRAYGLPFGINQKNNIRCSVSVGQGETLTIGFTADGDLVVYDTQDHIRCQVLNMEGSDGSAKDSPPRIAVANVGPHPVIIYLHPPVITHRTHVISHSTNYSSTPGSYAPRWAVFDPKKTTISNKGLTASCNGVSGQVVIGTQLPMVGLSGFVVQISRSDRTAGDSLGSGHFAGVVVSTFDKLEPHFEELRKDVDCLWIVQDVHDNDSLPTQEPIPLMDVANSAVFLSGTKLCFLLDRDNGTLSIARDYESPRIVFRNIPTGLSLSPFVRLDHAEAQATLSSFTCGLPSRAALKTPPHALLITQAVTPTNLRRAPYDVALSIFPVLRHVVCSLPPHLARAVSEGWGDHYNTTRFTYRLSVALRELANIGALSRHLTSASRETKGDIWSCAQVLSRSCIISAFAPTFAERIEAMKVGNTSISAVIEMIEGFSDEYKKIHKAQTHTLQTTNRVGQAESSCNGIMFDVVARQQIVQIAEVGFFSDTTSTVKVTLFARNGTFQGVEMDKSQWRLVIQREMNLRARVEAIITGFEPLVVPPGERLALFIHTESEEGILYYAGAESTNTESLPIEEEDDFVGITVGKTTVKRVPFTNVRQMEQLFSGSITYVATPQSSMCRSQLATRSAGPPPSQVNRVGVPVVVNSQRCGLLIKVNGDRSLVFLGGESAEWWHSLDVEEVEFDGSSIWEELESSLQKKLWESQLPIQGVPRQAFCVVPLRLHKSSEPSNAPGNVLSGSHQWWVSDSIRIACMLSIKRLCADRDVELFVATSVEGSATMYSSVSAVEHSDLILIRMDEWSRSVLSIDDHGEKIVAELPDGLSRADVRLVCRCIQAEKENIAPVCATLLSSRDDLMILETFGAPAFISFRASERPWCQLLLVGDRLVKCSWKPGDEPPSFTASTIDHSHNVYAVLIPHLSQQEPAIERQLAQTETSEWMSSCLVAHEQFRSKWVQREVVLCAQSSSLFVSGNCVQKVSVEVPSCCTAVEPHFEGVNVHEVELTVVMSTANPVQVIFRDAASQWCVAVPVAALCRCYQRCALKVDTAMSINLTLRVFPSSRCAFVIVDKSMIFEVLQGVTTFAARFNLAFSLTGLGSSVTITRWQVLEDGETPVTHSALDRIWGELNIRNISPYVPYSVAVSNCQTQRPLAPALTSGTCSTLLSQVEGLMVFYAWKLLGNMMVITTDRSTVEYLQQLMSSFIVRNNITVLENLMRTEMQRSSFLMLATASSSLAAPPVAQSLQEVEVSVNIVLGALRNDAMMPLLSTAYGPTLTLLLLRTAVAYTRTIRHMSLRCAILLLKTTHCPLPPHEALCSTLGPLFALMDKLCDKGKISSILVQLGTLLVCELTLRYALERPLLPVPGKNSSLPYALVTCAKVAVEAMMSKPPTPLPGIFAPPSEKVHNITYKLVTESRGFGDYLFCSGEFSESFTPTSGTKEFEARLSPSRVGIVVAGWNINPRVEPLDHQLQELYQEESTGIVALPSCGYSVDPDGNVFLCVGHRRESRPLKAKALDGDIIHVTCDYREHTIFIRLKRGSVDIISSHHNALSSEVMGLPVYFSESEADAHFNGEGLLFNSFTRADTVKLYPDAHELKEYQDTGVVPQSYEFYEELSLFRETLRASNKLGSSDFSEDPWIVPSHELADFRVLLDFLGADAFGNEALLNRLVPYLKRLQIFNAITSQFWKFVDVRHQTEMLELWRKLKNICFVETIEKLQEKVMGPFLNRPGHTTTVIIHPLRAKPCAQHGLYTALMRSVFGQLFIQLNASHAATFYASPMFTVNLAGFASIDAGGPYRDVISQLAAEIMTTHPGGMFQTNPLFRRCEHGGQVVVMPNMLVTLNMQSSLMFEFFGKLLAYCFVSEDILAVAFPPLFWKLLLSENISPRDLNVVDGVLMQQLNPEQPPAHAQEELGQGFPVTRSHYAALPSNGLQLERTPQLQPTYIHRAETLSRQDSLIELHSYDMVMRHIQRGFSEVVPLYLLNVFRWQTVERLICGAPKLSYAALRAVCEVNLNAASAHMFDEVISSMTDEDRMLVLRFATGQSRLPLRENIKVEPGGAANSLPTGATCFFTLRLPEYSSVDIMREKVLYAVRQCATIDGDGQAQGRVLLDD
uniref:HECT domain-containing protein n=1 Tax=Trypanosoma vivax (strain Y486) TaxID=1055687 RepID=G0TTQ8_TRYVY|nr:conserved hypothetical protein, fragment [Trypanosoma vivax Y486]